ncbi:MAG TPA: hypothetical protein VF469_19215 [Kofleriaceae bacterium]
MNERAEVLLWAQRVLGRRGATACEILEIAPGSGPEVAQEAFHELARMAHPDLHRRRLAPEELELVTTAYARAAAAYQELRSQRSAPRMRPAPASTSPPPYPAAPVPTSGEPVNPAQRMSSRALVHYRKAELSLRRGDLTGAVLQLKMAIASDPQSQLLRSALAEVEAEIRKKP